MGTRKIVAENLKRRMREKFGNAYGPRMLEERTGISSSTIERIRDCETGATVDTLAFIAMALQCEPADLFRPGPQE